MLQAQQQRDVQLVADLAEAKRAAVDALEQAQQLSGELAAARDRADAAQQRGQVGAVRHAFRCLMKGSHVCRSCEGTLLPKS